MENTSLQDLLKLYRHPSKKVSVILIEQGEGDIDVF